MAAATPLRPPPLHSSTDQYKESPSYLQSPASAVVPTLGAPPPSAAAATAAATRAPPQQENRALLSLEQRGRLLQQLLFVRTFGSQPSEVDERVSGVSTGRGGGGSGNGGDGGSGGGGGGALRSRRNTPPLSPVHRQGSDLGHKHKNGRSSSQTARRTPGWEGWRSASRPQQSVPSTEAPWSGDSSPPPVRRDDETATSLLPPMSAAPVHLPPLLRLPPLMGTRLPRAAAAAAVPAGPPPREGMLPPESSLAVVRLPPLRALRGASAGATAQREAQPQQPPERPQQSQPIPAVPATQRDAVVQTLVQPLQFPSADAGEAAAGDARAAPFPSPVTPASAAMGGGGAR